MSIGSSTNRGDFTGNGSATQFSFNFRADDETELLVYTKDLDGVETILELDTDYTVDGIGSSAGGEITLVAGALTTGYHLTILRNVLFKQLTSIRNQKTFFAETHEDTFDRIVMMIQQLSEVTARTLRLPPTTEGSAFNPIMPTVIGANQTICISGDGLGIVLGPTPAELSDASLASSNAVTAAEEAADSAEAAALSEAAAALSAALADASATDAAASAASSLSSATSASGFADNASGFADDAADSAVDAASHDILYGTGIPSDALGVDGNSYIDKAAGAFYTKAAGTWTLEVVLSGSSGVNSFNSRTGLVVPVADDYDMSMITGLVAALALKADDDYVADVEDQVALKADDAATTAALAGKADLALAVPTGGTIGQVLAKQSGTDNDVGWEDPGAVSPLTTKGDLYVFGSGNTRLPVGTDDQVLVADAAEVLGVKWADAPASLPTGGTTGQVLTKQSGTDGDAVWEDTAVTSNFRAGVESLANAATSVAVVFSSAMPNTNYAVSPGFECPDTDPIFLMANISNKTVSGFTASLNAPTDSANYKFNWKATENA